MAHPNALLMRKVDEALLAGDFAGFLALHTEDVVMHVPGSSPLSGDHLGRDGIAAVFQRELSMLDAASAAFYLAVGLAGLHPTALPRWLAVVTLVMGVACLLGSAGVGPAGIAVYLATPVWLIVTGIVL